GGGTGPALAEEDLLGDQPAARDRDAGLDLGAGAGEPLLLVPVREQPERHPPLDDREHLEPSALAEEVGDGGVPRLVGGDRDAVGLGVGDGLLEAQLLGQLGLMYVL